MRVHVHIQGALQKPNGKAELDVELADGSSVAALLVTLGYRREHLRFIVPGVNGLQQKQSRALCDGDEVTLFMPVSGG